MSEKSEKIIVIILALALIAIVTLMIINTSGITNKTTGFAVKETRSEKSVVKIGVVMPLSGESSNLGDDSRKAIELAKADLKNTKYDYQVIFEDDKNFDNKEALTAAQKLINIDKVDAMISLSSGTGNVISPLTEQNKVVHIGIASDGNVAKGEYNFIHFTTPSEEARTMVEALKNRNVKRLAVIVMNQQGAIAIADDLKKRVQGTEIQVVSEQMYNNGEKDFRALLIKIKKSNPDVIVLNVFSPELETLTKQAKELGITNLTSIESFEFSKEPELFNGLWYVAPAEPNNNFKNEYNAKYNQNPPFAAANSYDSFNLIVNSFENAGTSGQKPSTEKVALELAKTQNFKGALGNLNVLENHIIDSKAAIKQVVDGKFVTLAG